MIYDGADLGVRRGRLGHRRRRRGATGTPRSSSSPRSAGSRPGSPTWPGCPTELAVPRLDVAATAGAGRVGRRSPGTLVRGLPDRLARAAGGCSAAPTRVLWDPDAGRARAAGSRHPGPVRGRDERSHVVETGPLATVQDRGRLGLAHLGVPRAGALDAPAAALANRLVGNGAGRRRARGAARRAGAAPPTPAAGSRSPGRPARSRSTAGAAAPAPSGCPPARLRLGAPAPACAPTSPSPAGSPSSRCSARGRPTRSPGSARRGSRPAPCCRSGRPARRAAAARHAAAAAARAAAGPPGPRADWFAADALDGAVRGGVRRATPDSNRVGLRLDGPPLRRARDGRAAQRGDGARRGAGAARAASRWCSWPTTRRPAATRWSAVVDPDDLWQCAQLRPGEPVRFSVGGSSGVRRPPRAEVGVVVGVRAHRPGRGLGRLEAHGHHAAARAPDPAAAHARRARRPCPAPSARPARGRRHLDARAAARLLVLGRLAEQVLLDPVGQPGDADAEQPDAAGGVEVGEQAAGQPGDRRARCRWGRPASSSG